MLLVVIDQPRVRRRGEQTVVPGGQPLLAHIAVDDGGGAASCADARELLQPSQRVERVAAEELRRPLDGPALPSMLVTPVGLELRLTRKFEIEVRRAARGSGRASEDYAEHVCMLVIVDERAEAEQLACCLRRVPAANVGGRTFGASFSDACMYCSQLLLQDEWIVRTSLDVDEQAVEQIGRAH